MDVVHHSGLSPGYYHIKTIEEKYIYSLVNTKKLG
jgi:hypothetical protein